MRQKGQAAIHTLGLLFVMIMMGGFAIDSGLYFAAHRGMQNAADAAALAAVQELFKNTSGTTSAKMTAARTSAKTLSVQNLRSQLNDADIEFGYSDPATAYNSSNFLSPTSNTNFSSTGGYNAVRVTVKAGSGEANNAIPTIFSKFLGLNSFDSQAQAVAIYGGGVTSASGLRPVYMCQDAWDYAASHYNDPTVPQITFYGTTLQVGSTTLNSANSCGNMGPGNWGLADLDNGSGAPGASTVGDWFANGYSGQVNVGTNYDSQPGNSIHAYDSELTNLVNNQTVITIPLYDSTTGSGSNATFHVSQIAGFQITDFHSTGSASQRYIRGYFKKSLCHSGQCTTSASTSGGALTSVHLVH